MLIQNFFLFCLTIQLMKELREGLILALTHRERYSKHIHTALYDKESVLEKYLVILDEFDATIRNVFMVNDTNLSASIGF